MEKSFRRTFSSHFIVKLEHYDHLKPIPCKGGELRHNYADINF
jgi:uncharacterized protein Veg